MNSTMTWSSYLKQMNSESGAKFDQRVPNFLTNNLVFGVMISIIFLFTGCFFYVFRSIHASRIRETRTDPSNVRFGRFTKVPIERHVVPNNTSNNSSYLKCPANSMLHHPGHPNSSNNSRNNHSNDLIAYKLQMRLEKITSV